MMPIDNKEIGFYYYFKNIILPEFKVFKKGQKNGKTVNKDFYERLEQKYPNLTKEMNNQNWETLNEWL